MALTISGTSNGKLGNLSLSANTGDILDSANTTFFGADIWYLTANIAHTNLSTTGMTTGWARLKTSVPTGGAKSDALGVLGNAMTESSGQFTFPSTGIWAVHTDFAVNNGQSDTWYPRIFHTTDNFSTVGTSSLGLANTFTGVGAGRHTLEYFDIQDVSNYKVRFGIGSLASGQVEGNTDFMRSWVSFQRVGDT